LRGVLRLAKLRKYLEESEIGMAVQYFDEIVLTEEPTGRDDLKTKLSKRWWKCRDLSQSRSWISLSQRSCPSCPTLMSVGREHCHSGRISKVERGKGYL
jgi:hypothetical protein